MSHLYTLLQNLVKRAFISRIEIDDKDASGAQVGYLEKTGICEMVSPYGLYVVTPKDNPVLLFAVQSQEDNRAAFGYSQHTRFKDLKEGEVLLGNEKTKSFIKLDKDGNINIEGKAKVVINSTGDLDLTIQGDMNLTVNGKVNLTSTGDVDVDAPAVNLGTGGAAIARVGDTVSLTTGIILTGGTNTSI